MYLIVFHLKAFALAIITSYLSDCLLSESFRARISALTKLVCWYIAMVIRYILRLIHLRILSHDDCRHDFVNAPQFNFLKHKRLKSTKSNVDITIVWCRHVAFKMLGSIQLHFSGRRNDTCTRTITLIQESMRTRMPSHYHPETSRSFQWVTVSQSSEKAWAVTCANDSSIPRFSYSDESIWINQYRNNSSPTTSCRVRWTNFYSTTLRSPSTLDNALPTVAITTINPDSSWKKLTGVCECYVAVMNGTAMTALRSWTCNGLGRH